MPATAIDCVEVTGKTVTRLQLLRSETGTQEILLEFTDGTAFSLTIEPTTARVAYLFQQSNGAPETICRYDE